MLLAYRSSAERQDAERGCGRRGTDGRMREFMREDGSQEERVSGQEDVAMVVFLSHVYRHETRVYHQVCYIRKQIGIKKAGEGGILLREA